MDAPSNAELVAALVENARSGHNLGAIASVGFKAGYLEGLLINLMFDIPGVRADIEQRIEKQLSMKGEVNV